MNSMRILLVTGIFPPDHGGPASYVPAIAAALTQKHAIVGVITLSDALNHDDSAYLFPIIRLFRWQNKIVRTMKTVVTIIRFAKNADLVYLNGLVLEGIIACKILGSKKVVIKVVGDLVWERARNAGITQNSLDEFQQSCVLSLKWRLLRKMQSWYMGLADMVITPSYYLAGIVYGWGVLSGKVKVIYNSVLAPQRLTSEEFTKTVDCVTVARLVPWKGVTELIRIAGSNQFTLNIVGDGPERSRLEKQVVDEGLEKLISFRGHVPKDQVSGEIAKARIFILNSTYEGLPHIVLEAKAVGVPVIATAVGGTVETITDNSDGFLVPVGDSEALSGRIKYLLERPEERERIALAGYKRVLEQFSFEAMLSETERVLGAVCTIAKRA
jgi:glycosyltransferase involved in cell wall biosynthesis